MSFYGATAEEANNKKFKALADQAAGVLFTDPGRLTVGDYLRSWLSDTARYQVAQSTYSRYQRTCDNHLIPFFDRVRLRELSSAHVRAFKARKLEEALNPNTVGLMHGVLSGALNQAVHDGLIASNPASRVKKAATRGTRPMCSLSLEEASRLVAAAEGTRDEAPIVVALRTCIRQGELAALRWEDVELTTRPTITVRRSADTRTSRPIVTTTKTGEERCVRIGPRTVEVLRHHLARQRKERVAAKSWADPGLVFPNTLGAIRRRNYVMESYRRILKVAGLPTDLRFHDLRHPGAPAGDAHPRCLQDARPLRPRYGLAALRPRPRGHGGRGRPGDGRALLRGVQASLDPVLYPNRPQPRPTQTDSGHCAIADIPR